MKTSIFKFIDRGEQDSVVLIPGWATDYRIFDSLDLKFNYLIPLDFSPFVFEECLLDALEENNLDKISLFGYSLGGFLAAQFAAKHVELIDRLILVSIRKRYKKERIEVIKNSLRKNKKGYLYKFYSQSFYDKEQFLHFKRILLKDYCEKLDLKFLLKSLDYLSETELKPELLKKIKKITIFHAEDDQIAPLEEALQIKNALPHAEFITIKGAGHILFWEKDFSKYIL